MEYEEYSLQQYITVFWDFNKSKNSFISNLLNYSNKINSFDINKVDDSDYSNNCFAIINDYRMYINKIKGLSDCLELLLKQPVFNKFEKYDEDYLLKISQIYNHLDERFNKKKNISVEKFKIFMYNNTAEGRIILQNNSALEILKQLKVTEDYIKTFNKKINEIKLEKSQSQIKFSKENCKVNDNDNDSVIDSDCSSDSDSECNNSDSLSD
jgi:hypothetical protein